MAVSFGRLYAVTSPEHGKVVEGIIKPTLSSSSGEIAAGILGAVIMPHNIYLHSALVLSR